MTAPFSSLTLMAALATASCRPNRTSRKTTHPYPPHLSCRHRPDSDPTEYSEGRRSSQESLQRLNTSTLSSEPEPPAEPRKFYTVRYTGWLPDGTKFDSSYDHPGGEPITFPYGAHRVIIGWDTGFEGMRIGGKRRLFVPYQLAYGEMGRPPQIPAKSNLIFDVELVALSDAPPSSPGAKPNEAAPRPAATPSNTAPAPATPPSPTSQPAQPTTPPHPQAQ